jgi:hypothetical protein
MQHSNKHTCNIRLEKQLKYWEQKLTTYLYNHCNIWNIARRVSTLGEHLREHPWASTYSAARDVDGSERTDKAASGEHASVHPWTPGQER